MSRLRGLYAITLEHPGPWPDRPARDDGQAGRTRAEWPMDSGQARDPQRPGATQGLAQQVALAIAGGARVIQYRDKARGRAGDTERRLAEARALHAVCHAAGVPFIINDDLALAAAVAANGIHLGRDDAAPAEARRLLGADAIIGVSCYDRLELAEAAQAAGADYVAFGSFFPSSTKPLAVRAGLDLLRRARDRIRVPLVAIGGITPENGAALIAAGADLLAVISGIFGGPDPRTAARRYASLFDTPDPGRAHDPLS
jgi:thiamine-phosphate pyrophosphorylase